MSSNPNFLRWTLALALSIAGLAGLAAIWTTAAVLSGQALGWLALFAAFDSAWLLRLGGAPKGVRRVLAAVLGTALAIALSYWMIVATLFGLPLGLEPIDSFRRMGPSLAWDLSMLLASDWDIAFAVAALPLAAWWAHDRSRQR